MDTNIFMLSLHWSQFHLWLRFLNFGDGKVVTSAHSGLTGLRFNSCTLNLGTGGVGMRRMLLRGKIAMTNPNSSDG